MLSFATFAVVEPALADSGQAAAGARQAADSGLYTRAQAKAGAALYARQCLVCHDKNYFRPVLKRWQGQPVSVLFDVMSTSMPESNPGGLLDQEYADILAYIFSRSKYPVGERALNREDAGFDTLLIPAP